jgi:DNA-binding Lrp family transcriptional regulator
MSETLEQRVQRATQAGLPLVPQPYHALAQQLGIRPDEVMRALSAMLADGRIRRIGVVPNHYAIGYVANGMSVWDVADEAIGELGPRVGALAFVSHCYRRPRRLPEWRYNLFAMVHGRRTEEVEERVGEIASLLGSANRAHEVLYSRRILKKTGLRF